MSLNQNILLLVSMRQAIIKVRKYKDNMQGNVVEVQFSHKIPNKKETMQI